MRFQCKINLKVRQTKSDLVLRASERGSPKNYKKFDKGANATLYYQIARQKHSFLALFFCFSIVLHRLFCADAELYCVVLSNFHTHTCTAMQIIRISYL